MVSTLIAAASMTACSSQPSETTAAESTQENDTSAESSDASETTTAGEKETAQTTDADYAEDETLSEKEITPTPAFKLAINHGIQEGIITFNII